MPHQENITIENYQKHAMRTCLPSAKNRIYAYYGVLSEVHELCSKIDGMRAKRVRDGLDFNNSNHLNKIADEIGDVLWFVALWCELLDVSFSKKISFNFSSPNKIHIPFWYDYSDKDISYLELTGIIAFVQSVLSKFNFDINEILQRNIDKLASRAERGVIKGNGDER